MRLPISFLLLSTLMAPSAAGQAVIRGSSAVRGRILDSSNNPITGATVSRDGSGDTARADAQGNFLLGQLALGRHVFTVAAPGYQAISFEVDFTGTHTASVDIPLERGGAMPGASLAPAGSTKLEQSGFAERRRNPPSSAAFFTAEDISARNIVRLSQLMDGTRDLTLRTEQGNIVVAYGHDRRCLMNVWLDGNQLENVFPSSAVGSGGRRRQTTTTTRVTGLDEILPLSDIAAVEVYTLPSQIPPRYQAQQTQASATTGRSRSVSGAASLGEQGGNCGAILIWSR